ncbi:TIGR02391 family protein [Arthrobacter sp. NPDC056727]|uniref:TIGR02391 family protein n=1 Tax=Arthrobacter sp. NPDC056727 TaxID=3345927 RepID=UPI00366CEB8A
MDEHWAMEQLRHFIDLTRLKQPKSEGGVVYMGDFAVPVGSRNDIIASAHVVEKILDRTIRDWWQIAERKPGRWERHREGAQRALVELERSAEIAEKLGDNAPQLSAAAMHPWIWEAARSLWQSGHYQEAVRAASVKVNAELQNMLGRRDISESDLFKQALSSDPAGPDKPRLRPYGDDGGKTSLSVRRGVAAFAERCFAGIRNPASHEVLNELTEQEALEQLAAFSILARWVATATVVR